MQDYDFLIYLKCNKKTQSFSMIVFLAFDLNGAGDGNRTHVNSLEGYSSTIELHPQKNGAGKGT